VGRFVLKDRAAKRGRQAWEAQRHKMAKTGLANAEASMAREGFQRGPVDDLRET
jgi:hypothetical protein